MATAEARIQELKLTLPPAPRPVAKYKTALLIGNLLYVSGHGPLKTDKTLITGRVGADLDLPAGKLAARQVGLAILATLRAELGTLDRVKRVISQRVDQLAETPEQQGKPLVGELAGFRSIRAVGRSGLTDRRRPGGIGRSFLADRR